MSWNTKKEALAEARAVKDEVARVAGKGWRIHVQENAGWHVEFRRGALQIILAPSDVKGKPDCWFFVAPYEPRTWPKDLHFSNVAYSEVGDKLGKWGSWNTFPARWPRFVRAISNRLQEMLSNTYNHVNAMRLALELPR